jgi:hypothetical protein
MLVYISSSHLSLPAPAGSLPHKSSRRKMSSPSCTDCSHNLSGHHVCPRGKYLVILAWEEKKEKHLESRIPQVHISRPTKTTPPKNQDSAHRHWGWFGAAWWRSGTQQRNVFFSFATNHLPNHLTDPKSLSRLSTTLLTDWRKGATKPLPNPPPTV